MSEEKKNESEFEVENQRVVVDCSIEVDIDTYRGLVELGKALIVKDEAALASYAAKKALEEMMAQHGDEEGEQGEKDSSDSG